LGQFKSKAKRSLRQTGVMAAMGWALLMLTAAITPVQARGVYQQPAEFIRESFNGSPPPPSALWLTAALQSGVRAILKHPYRRLRIRYWHANSRSAWVLDEVGKEAPITVGIVVRQGQIEKLRVLVYRESRGEEVRQPFFTAQFRGQVLRKNGQLSKPVDGITGATLSVRALKRLSALALWLDARIRAGQTTHTVASSTDTRSGIRPDITR